MRLGVHASRPARTERIMPPMRGGPEGLSQLCQLRCARCAPMPRSPGRAGFRQTARQLLRVVRDGSPRVWGRDQRRARGQGSRYAQEALWRLSQNKVGFTQMKTIDKLFSVAGLLVLLSTLPAFGQTKPD